MTLHRVDETDMIAKIVSLAVKPKKESVLIRKTLQMTVTCNCVTLGYAYSDLKVVWKIGDTVWKDYGTTVPLSVIFILKSTDSNEQNYNSNSSTK